MPTSQTDLPAAVARVVAHLAPRYPATDGYPAEAVTASLVDGIWTVTDGDGGEYRMTASGSHVTRVRGGQEFPAPADIAAVAR